MATKHTSGDWAWDAEKGVYTTTAPTIILADAIKPYADGLLSLEEVCANAALMAASPSMLDALRCASDFLDAIDHPESDGGGVRDAISAAIAIAKAKEATQ